MAFQGRSAIETKASQTEISDLLQNSIPDPNWKSNSGAPLCIKVRNCLPYIFPNVKRKKIPEILALLITL